MLLEIDHHSGVPIYLQVIEQIKHQVMSGQLSEGQQLVSVRELAEQMRVNPMTISKAYALLEIEGLVERRRGVGIFIAKIGSSHKEQARRKILERIVNKAAAKAVQFGVSEEDLHRLLSEEYNRYNQQTGRLK
jgi:GntR family transcriptional regulator